MTVKKKLIITFFIIVMFVVEIGGVILYSNQEVAGKLQEIQSITHQEMELANDVAYLIQRLKSNIRELFLEMGSVVDNSEKQNFVGEINHVKNAIQKSASGLKSAVAKWKNTVNLAMTHQSILKTHEERVAKLQRLDQFDDDMRPMLHWVDDLLAAVDNTMANTTVVGIQFHTMRDVFNDKIEPISRELQSAISELKQAEKLLMTMHFQDVRKALNFTTLVSTISIISAILVAIILGFFSSRSIATPLGKLQMAAIAIGKGKYDTAIGIETTDEIGTLADSFRSMIQSIQAQQRYVQNIISSIADTVLVVSSNNQLLQVNRIELLAYTEDELIGMSVENLFAEDEAYLNNRNIQTLIKSGNFINVESTIKTKDNREIPVMVSGSALRGNKKEGDSTILIIKDITEYQQARNKLEHQSWHLLNAAKFGEIVQKAETKEDLAINLLTELAPFCGANHGLMYILDEDTKLYHLMGSYGSQECAQIKSTFAPGEFMVGQCVRENALLRFDVPKNYIKITSGLGDASPVEIITIPISFQKQVLAVLEIAAFNRFTDKHMLFLDEFMPIVGLGLDNLMRIHRTERLLSQTLTQSEQLHEQQKSLSLANQALNHQKQEVENKAAELQRANKYKSSFLSTMSHEIRTPISAIIGLTTLALRTDLAPKTRDYLIKIETSSASLLRLINDILDFSKIEAGKLDLESVEFRLSDVFDHLADLFRDKAAEKYIELIMWVPREHQCSLIGDSYRLKQILMNLISNAIKFTPKGEIIVQVSKLESTTEKQTMFEFSVQDSGIGVTQEQIQTLFTPFIQADDSITREYGGSGLGLSICKNLATLMGGQIWVDSTPGTGSVFRFTVALAQSQHANEDGALTTPRPLQGLKVLVVDDNPIAGFVVNEILHSFDFEPLVVNSGEAAIIEMHRSIEAGPAYELVLMDYIMPAMDGIETAHRIIEIVPQNMRDSKLPKLILLTAFGKIENTMVRAKAAGFDAYLEKPINPSLLFDTIMEIFGQQVAKRYHAKDKITDYTEVIEKIGNARILLVEDLPINQQVARELLECINIKVDVANNGSEAVRMIAECPYDAVLMDIQMPVMDGYTATSLIRKEPRFARLPIIAMTAHTMDGDQEKCFAAGMNAHVSKPIDVEQLFAVLLHWLPHGNKSAAIMAPISKNSRADAADLEMPSTLPGIDIIAGLGRLGGNQRLLLSLLLEFQRNYADAATAILTTLSDQGEGDKATAVSTLHAIKGAAGNLGANTLHAAARDLEMSIKQDGREDWSQLTEHFEQSLNIVMTSIATLQLNQKRTAPAQPITTFQTDVPLNLAEITPQLLELAKLLDKGNISAGKCIAPLQALLVGHSIDAELTKLADQIEFIDFDGALQTIVTIANTLNIPWDKNT